MPIYFALHPIKTNDSIRTLTLWIAGIFFVLIIGLRHDVGGDWDRYISIYAFHKGIELNFLNFRSGDFAYETIHWFSLNYLNGIYSTNLISAIIFISGLIRFCRIMPLPWVALFVSVHFLVIVVSMGYTRQSAAVGLLLWGLVDLIKGKNIQFYIYILIGALFHKTLLVMLPVGYLYNNEKFSIIRLISFTSIFLISAYLLLMDKIQKMFYYYIEIEFHQSGGALIRVFMSFVAALIFFIYRKKFRKRFHDEKLWFIFSVVSIILLPASYFYSTFSDRIAIYFLPLQLVILSRIPMLIESTYNRTIFILYTAIIYISALYVWLIFGTHSNKWLPYQNILF
jgi:hypothetical protein